MQQNNTVTSHERHGVLNPGQLLFNSPLILTTHGMSKLYNMKALSDCSFVRGIHWWPVDSPHGGRHCRNLLYTMMSSLENGRKYLIWRVPLIEKWADRKHGHRDCHQIMSSLWLYWPHATNISDEIDLLLRFCWVFVLYFSTNCSEIWHFS